MSAATSRPPAPAPRLVPPAALTAWAVLAVLGPALEVGLPLQPLLVLPFALTAPGLAMTTLLRIGDRLTRLVLSVAMSAVIATIAAQVLLALGRWSPIAWITTLAVLTAALAWAPSVARPRTATRPTSDAGDAGDVTARPTDAAPTEVLR